MKKFILGIILSIFSFGILTAQDNPVHWSFSSKKISDCEYELTFKAKIDEPWHLYSLNKAGDEGPNPTVFTFKKNSDYELVGKVKQGKPLKEFDKVFEMNVEYYKHEATFTQRIKLLTDKKIKITGKYEYQACTEEKCIFPPADNFDFELQGTAACNTGSSATATTPTSTDSTVKDSTNETAVQVAEKDSADQASAQTGAEIKETHYANEKKSISQEPWWLIFIQGLGWGLAALLTPCVFPLIPMNVSFFLKKSKTQKEGRKNALIYALSIIVIFITLGLSISLIFGAGALHTFSTSAGFNLVLFAMLLVFAASFLGAFEITLPSAFVNNIDKQSDRGGYLGIFFMALALVVVSFSCTGVMVGNALVIAAKSGSISGPFWAMFGFSLGLAIPFGLFAFFPSMLNSVPKSGGWLNTVKVTLGFVELALALKFASNVDLVYQWHILTREVFIGLWIVIFGLLGVYLIGGFKTSHDSDLKHVSVTRLFFAITSFFITIYLIPGMWGAPLKIFSGILPPLEYSESPHGFGGSGSAHTVSVSENPVDKEFAQYIEVNKNGIVHFKNDYEHALAYAKKVGKPLMVDFTGHACANCRKTEDYVWPDGEVTKRLNNDVVLVSLYVDDKRELAEKDYMNVHWYGKDRVITDIGDKFKYMEETLYGQSTQPLYVLLDHNEKLIAPVRGYDPNIADYVKWLDDGINTFKSKQK